MSTNRNDVDKLFPRIKDKLGYNDNELNLDWLESLRDFFSSMSSLFQVIFIAAVIALLAFIIYKLIMRFSKSGSKIIYTAKNEKSIENRKLNEILNEITLLKAENKFTMATLHLHHATILYLLENQIIVYTRDYTNKEIVNLLNDSDLLASFTTIAVRSQGILFNNEKVNEADFNELEKEYYEVFR